MTSTYWEGGEKMIKKFFSIHKKTLLLVCVFVGIILSVATVKGLAYTESSDFCGSCHIMNQAHASFEDSAHADLACGECHVPNDSVVSKYAFKAKSGFGHVYYNIAGTEKIPKVLHATKESKDIITENCISCHESTLETVSHNAKENCSSCHEAVPHGSGFKTEDFNKPAKSGELLKNKGGTMDNG